MRGRGIAALMLLALALGPGTSWLNHQDARWAQGISAALAAAWADARFWLIGALLTGSALGVLGALTRRNGRMGVLAALVAPLLPIAELTMLVITAAPQTAQDRFGLHVRIVTLALALAWLLTVPIVQRAQWATSPRHT